MSYAYSVLYLKTNKQFSQWRKLWLFTGWIQR